MSDTPITVPEFVKVRQHIANLLKENSQTQAPTRIRQAENLLMAGVIDVAAVLDHLTPKPDNLADGDQHVLGEDQHVFDEE